MPNTNFSNYSESAYGKVVINTTYHLPQARSAPHRLCQGETVKVKFVYNRLTGENGGRPNQISHHLQKSMHAPRLDRGLE